MDRKINILVPMAGAGKRFRDEGYDVPKPLIKINGNSMIEVVIKSLDIDANYIYIVQKEHYENHNIEFIIKSITPNYQIIVIDGITEGAVCTTLTAEKLIDNDIPLLIANSDQFIEWDSGDFLNSIKDSSVDGSILTFKTEVLNLGYSYAKVGNDGFVCEVAEKKPISDIATVGVYFWNKGSDYVKYSQQMIDKNIRVNNEFYVCPVYNEAIIDKRRISIYNVNKMWGLGTPEDLKFFMNNYERI